MKTLTIIFTILTVILLFVPSASAQDPTKVDSQHYKVVFENDQVRVLRISYGPHEKSVMHYHPAGVAVFLTSGKGKFTFADGTTKEMSWDAGQTVPLEATKHQPENLTDQPFELIQVELKTQPKVKSSELY